MLLQPAFAKDFKTPSEDAIATVAIPDAWKPESYSEEGVQAISDDGTVYLAVESTGTKTVEAAMEESFAYLKEKGVTVDTATAKQNRRKH